MNQHDRTMMILALDTAITEASRAVSRTDQRAPEYRGYQFALREFERLKRQLETDNGMHKL